MLLLPLPSIQISPNRQRREFDDAKIQELATSIAAVGLLSPIVVRSLGRAGFQLVCGERRLRALQNLWFLGKPVRHGDSMVSADTIPCVTLGELDELAAEEAELDENIKRIDLSWQERAAATARVAALRSRQAEARGQEAPKVAAIAQEVRGSSEGVHHEATRREIIVAKHLDNPEVAKAKNLDDAFKVLRRQEDTQRNVQLAAAVGRTFTAAIHEAYHADALAWMAAARADQFDCICTDPPYGMGADQFGDSDGKAAGAHKYDDSYENWLKIIPTFARESFRLAKAQAHAYVFCDIDRFHELKNFMAEEGWNCFRTPLIWYKPTGSRLPWVDFGPQRKYELVLYANKGRRPVTRIYGDVASYPPDENMGHQAQKPVALFVDWIRRCVAPGNLVLDPFAGSGPAVVAAHELKCKAVLVEKDAASYGLILKRMEALKAQQDLPLEKVDTKALLEGLK